ncbi:unnamed protein product [Acanthosepion pharaonis]|uniref:Uncharacterized protein n=1 Tax=Acanthosepion pharaonis TaxID=158019 RepID=A0A812CKJ9_ACAPH|nr:unnamed protein product [Sepia pharaonis]
MLSLQPFSESILPSFFPILFHRPLFLFSIFIPKSTILLFLYLFLHDSSSSTSFFFNIKLSTFLSDNSSFFDFFLSILLHRRLFLFSFFIPTSTIILSHYLFFFFTILLHRHLFSFNVKPSTLFFTVLFLPTSLFLQCFSSSQVFFFFFCSIVKSLTTHRFVSILLPTFKFSIIDLYFLLLSLHSH